MCDIGARVSLNDFTQDTKDWFQIAS